MLTEQQREQLAERINQISDWAIDYETTHGDSGAGYFEGMTCDGFQARDGFYSDLRQWLVDNQTCEGGEAVTLADLADIDETALWDAVADACEMEPGHMFSNSSNTALRFHVAAWACGETCSQPSIGELSEDIGHPWDVVTALLNRDFEQSLECCVDVLDRGDTITLTSYCGEDTWVCYVPAANIEGILEQLGVVEYE